MASHAQQQASQHNQNVTAAQQQGQLGGAKLQPPTQPTPQPPNGLEAYSSPQPPPLSHQQSSSQDELQRVRAAAVAESHSASTTSMNSNPTITAYTPPSHPPPGAPLANGSSEQVCLQAQVRADVYDPQTQVVGSAVYGASTVAPGGIVETNVELQRHPSDHTGLSVLTSTPPTIPTSSPTSSSSKGNTLRVRRSTYVPGWAFPPRVLVVDDDLVSRRLCSKFLQVSGCTIDAAVDGVGAVNKMNLEKYDLVLMVSFPSRSRFGRECSADALTGWLS